MEAENGIIAGMKHPCREIQNGAVAQPLVVGRMTAVFSGIYSRDMGVCLRLSLKERICT